MSLCYHCGKEGETTSCPHCGISYCLDHLNPKAHKCMVYEGTSNLRRKKEKTSAKKEVIVEEVPIQKKSKDQKGHNRMIIAVGMIMISLSSTFLVAMSSGGVQGLPGVTPTEVNYEYHSIVLGQVNTYRARNGLPDFVYDISDMPQDWAFQLSRSNRIDHNPDLPSSMGENVAIRTEKGQDPRVTIVMMIQDMVINDVKYDNANKANILGKYERMCIGVAVNGDTVVLVLNFG